MGVSEARRHELLDESVAQDREDRRCQAYISTYHINYQIFIHMYIYIVNDQNQVSCVEGGQQCPSAAVMTRGTKDVGRVPRCGIVGKGRKWLDH